MQNSKTEETNEMEMTFIITMSVLPAFTQSGEFTSLSHCECSSNNIFDLPMRFYDLFPLK